MTNAEKELYANKSGMSVDDINDHLDKYSNGGSYLVRDDAFENYIQGKPTLGYEDNSNYILSSDEMDKVIADSHGDTSYIETQLGFDKGYLGNGPLHRVDVNNPAEHDVRMATGKEMGANIYFNTPTDADGKLPNIKQDWPAKNETNWQSASDHPDKTLPIVDSSKNNIDDAAKLNGEYFDEKGNYHEPNLQGYRGQTSGGNSEAVVNQIANTPENVTHRTYDGLKCGEASDHMTCVHNDNAYFQPSALVSSQNDTNSNITQAKEVDRSVTMGGAEGTSGDDKAHNSNTKDVKFSTSDSNMNQREQVQQSNNQLQGDSPIQSNQTQIGADKSNSQSQSSGQESNGSSGMSTIAAGKDQTKTGNERKGSSDGMSTTAAGQSGNAPSSSLGQSQSSGQSM